MRLRALLWIGILGCLAAGCPWKDPGGTLHPRVFGVTASVPVTSDVYVTMVFRQDGLTLFRGGVAPLGTFVSLTPGPAQFPNQVVADPRTPGTVYAVLFDNTGTSTTYPVRKSTDRGATWTTMITPIDQPVLTADPAVTDRLWLRTFPSVAGNPVLQRSDDGGQTWVRDDAGLTELRDLTLDAAGAGLRYGTGASSSGLRADALGATWTPIPAPNPRLLADPGVANRVYAWGSDGVISRSDDRGATWTDLLGGRLAVGGSRALAFTIDPADPARLYLGIEGAGLWVSADGGGSFTPTGFPTFESPFQVTVDPTGSTRLFAVTFSGRAFVSEDRGATWRELDLSPATALPFLGQRL